MSADKLPPLPSAYQYPRPYATPDGRPLFTAEQMQAYALAAIAAAPAPEAAKPAERVATYIQLREQDERFYWHCPCGSSLTIAAASKEAGK
jgi:hypothetical protein